MHWLEALTYHTQRNEPCVLVTVIDSEGSAPRKIGTRMVIAATIASDTLGGGALEMEAIQHARYLLQQGHQSSFITHRRFSLGKDLTQCCGGRVTLQFDCQWENTFQLYVFGAGHVAQELVRMVARLPCRACFLDDRKPWREKLTNQIPTEYNTPQACVTTQEIGSNPYGVVEACSPGAYFLIMTHSHELDFELVEAVLSRSDSAYCGLIASKSKAASFCSRLQRKGFSEQEIQSLTAPIGQRIKTGNVPMEVAIAAMSDILDIREGEMNKPTMTVNNTPHGVVS